MDDPPIVYLKQGPAYDPAGGDAMAWAFLSALYAHWKQLVGGGCVLMIAVALWEHLTGQSLSWRHYVTAILLIVVWAAWLAWRDEHHARASAEDRCRALQTDLDAERQRNRPDIRTTIERYAVGEHRDVGTTLFITISVRNLGLPSVLENWHVEVRMRDKAVHPALILFDGKATLEEEGGAMRVEIDPDDVLYKKTVAPIATGAMVRGWLGAALGAIPREEVTAAGTLIIVTFVDVTGRVYRETKAISGNKAGGFQYYPGTRDVVIRSPKQNSPEA